MCGRFSLNLNGAQIRRIPGYDENIREWIDENAFVPRYNIAPRTHAPVILCRKEASETSSTPDTSLILHTMKWGLVPHWSKFEDKSLSTTNARAENLVEGGGMWGSIKGKKRCAIPVQGYYEWLSKGRDKLPHFTKRKDGHLMILAGLYDSVVLEGRTLWTFTIVTTGANKDFSWLHDRQPVILSSRESLEKWLDTSSRTWTPELTELVKPYQYSSVLEWRVLFVMLQASYYAHMNCSYQVPKEVGKVGTESPSFIKPIAGRKDGIQAMFSRQRATKEKVPSTIPAVKRKRSPSPSPAKIEKSTGVQLTPKKPKRELESNEYNQAHKVSSYGIRFKLRLSRRIRT
ncbi:hypothetical protein BDQ17DRAFT_1372147 [Cyathus striatus]|nr:hypothetical protein BDQ17DRAFT_1372147 [Cyathus striatus]